MQRQSSTFRSSFGLLLVGLSACLQAGSGENPDTPPVGTYDDAARANQPLPAGEGSAPFEGSLGPPRNQVNPDFDAPSTTTREGSAGPPNHASAEE